jgi:hypothetical protein
LTQLRGKLLSGVLRLVLRLPHSSGAQVLSLLALLVQKYKY